MQSQHKCAQALRLCSESPSIAHRSRNLWACTYFSKGAESGTPLRRGWSQQAPTQISSALATIWTWAGVREPNNRWLRQAGGLDFALVIFGAFEHIELNGASRQWGLW